MKKTKEKAIEQSGVRKGSPMEGVRSMAGMNKNNQHYAYVYNML